MKLSIVPNKFAVCRMDPDREMPFWAKNDIFFAITRTVDEWSVVTLQNLVPLGVKAQKEWRLIKILGPMDFTLVGVLNNISTPLAKAGISIFVISTYDTDYILVKHDDLAEAIEVLRLDGYEFID
jgi:hypothetical protein